MKRIFVLILCVSALGAALISPASSSAAVTPAQVARQVIANEGRHYVCSTVNAGMRLYGFNKAKAVFSEGNAFSGRVFEALVSICA